MKLRALFPAVAFLSLLMLFSVAAASFLSISPVSSVHAQNGAPGFPEDDENGDPVDYTREVNENTKPYDEDLDYVMIGDPMTATGSGIIYSIENARTAHFGINSYTGHLLVGSALDYETQDTYTVMVVAKNTSGTARQEVTINVNNLDEPGQVTLKWQPASGSGVDFTATLTDPDGISGTPSWQWQELGNQNDQNPTNLDQTSSSENSSTFNNTTSSKYLRATATYTDTHASNKTVSATLEVEKPDYLNGYTLGYDIDTSGGYSCAQGNSHDVCVNVSRNVTPGDDIYYPSSIKYTHNSKQDRYPSRRSLSYSLGGADKDDFDIHPSNGNLLPKGPHGYENKEKYSITITAADPYGEDDEIKLEVGRIGSNNNPVVQGPRVIRYPENGTWQVAKYTGKLQGREQDRDVGWIIGVQPGGGDGDFFDIDDDGVLYFDLPPDYEQGQKEYSFSLHAYDSNPPGMGRPGQTFYSVRVVVEDVNDPPEIVGPTDVDFPENSTDAVAEYTVEGVDAGETANWKLEEGDDASKFSITPTTSTGVDSVELSFKSPPNYESFNTANDEHIFLLTIMVDVGGEMKTEHVRVEVTDVNEAPSFPSVTTTRNVGENAGPNEDIGAPVEATDPDKSDSLNYDLTGSDDDDSFYIVSYSGQLQTKTGVDYGVKNSYSVTVSVTDNKDADGNDEDTADDTITVTITTREENDPPVFADATATREVPENSPANTNVGDPITADDEDGNSLTYTLEGTGTDKDSFTIDNTGQIKTVLGVTYDYEAKSSYSVTVKADDSKGGTDTIDVTITLTNVDEDGTVTFDPIPPKAGTPLTATVDDPDGNVSGDTWEWSSSTNANTNFAVISGADAATYTPTADDVGKYLKAKATYTDPEDSGKSAEGTTAAAVTAANTSPNFPGGNNPTRITLTVAENSHANTQVGTVSATDSDTATLIYSVDGDPAEVTAFHEAFFLNDSTGEITVLANDSLDHETTDTYTFDIGVSDGKDAAGESDTVVDSTVSVTINVTDVNEAPTFDETGLATRTVAENTEAGENIGAVFTATDPDNENNPNTQTLTYTLGGDDAASFTIETVNGEGQLKTKTGVTYDHEGKETYSVTVSVRDSKDADGNSDTVTDDTIDVTINLTNVDEDGTVTFDPIPPKAGTPLTATVDDPDGNVSGDTWEWSSSTNANTNFTVISGADAATYTPTADDVGKYLKAKATYTDPEDSGKSAEGTTAAAVTAANTSPNFPGGNNPTPITLTVAENSHANTQVGTVSATDSDTATLIYSVDDDPAEVTAFHEAFFLNDSTGEITVLANDSLDHETTDTYTFDIGVSDGKDAAGESDTVVDSTVAVTINVTDVNEPPVFATETDTRTIAENTAAGENIGDPFTATDPDNENNPNRQTLTYTLGGADAASFTIETVNGEGQLKTKTGVTYDHEVKETYSVTVSVRDSKDADGNSDTVTDDTIDVTINLTNVDEDGTVTFDPIPPKAGTPLTATVDDPDGNVSGDTWEWSSSTNANTNFTVISGADAATYTPTADDVGKYLKAKATYTDPEDSGKSAEGTTAAAVTAANTSPNFPGGNNPTRITLTVAENSHANTQVGTVSATDSDTATLIYSVDGDPAEVTAFHEAFFLNDSTGEITVLANDSLDHETTDTYTFDIGVSDGKDAAGESDTVVDSTVAVTINVTDVNEATGVFATETGYPHHRRKHRRRGEHRRPFHRHRPG